MYISIEETAEYLGMPVEQVRKYVWEGRIRAVHDGKQYLINQNQFGTYFTQLELVKKQIEDYLSEPLPPDRDIKDED
ncbi:excisionase family DNA-binding protein [Sporosarcina sp. ACRSL]|uniref:excisionase family DNA-binding protein n=1 Tax=Sporosarcina sp. ACRSL TaxID=2918215 RepID=UPI001EF648E0|nr:excisionase family DNA-binding protein [Sporosarcina sp. ACRSL]MCG7343718.1 excisionase family DNA-binding protein [Sporosarcina sp. ACRSL]